MANAKLRVFLVEFLNYLEPRRYEEQDGIIQDQFQEVYEVLFVTSGNVLVGYRLFNDIFYTKSMSNQAIVGDFACLYNKVSEFLYKPQDILEGYSIKKENF